MTATLIGNVDKPKEGIQGGQGVRTLGDRFVDGLRILELGALLSIRISPGGY